MKRPLCALALFLTAAVWLYLELFYSDSSVYTGASADSAIAETGGSPVDGSSFEIIGRVSSKELVKSYTGEDQIIIYVVPIKSESDSRFDGMSFSRNSYSVQCYMESGGSCLSAFGISEVGISAEKSSCGDSSADVFGPAIGTYVRLSGRVKQFPSPTNPGEFDSRLYYNTLKISYRLMDARVLATGGKVSRYREYLFRLKTVLGASLDAVLEPEDAGIMKAMLLGDKSSLDSDVKESFKAAGVVHCLCISGSHIAVLGMGVFRLLKLFSNLMYRRRKAISEKISDRKKNGQLTGMGMPWIHWPLGLHFGNAFACATSVLVMYSYGVMCGMGSSSFRAILMFGLRMVAPLLGRTYDILSALALAEILLLLDQPLYLYNSGFLMSFGAVIGIVVVRPCLKILCLRKEQEMQFVKEKAESRCKSRIGKLIELKISEMINVSFEGSGSVVVNGILTSIAIGLATLPVYGLYYYTYPLHSILLNLLVIPALGVLLMLGVGSMAFGALVLAAGAGGAVTASVGIAAITGGCLFNPLTLGIHIILFGYKWLCSFSGLNAAFTWYMGHSEKWQVVAYITLMCLFVVLTKRYEKQVADERRRLADCNREIDCRETGEGYGSGNGRNDGCTGAAGIGFIDIKNLSMPGRIARYDIARFAVLIAAVLLFAYRSHPDLAVNMIDVDQGDGIIVSSAGKNLLIDGGSTSKKNVGKYRIIPVLKYMGIGALDGVVVTHEDEDHISGILEIMDDMEKGGIRIRKLIMPEVADSSKGNNYHQLHKRATELGIPILYINSSESFRLGKAELTCLNPARGMVTSEANAYSTVLYLRCGEFTALFTGDMEGEGLQYVKGQLRSMENITLLKVAHHGSRFTTDEEFLELTHPRIALISCGHDNSYGHPHRELLDRLEETGARVYRTDESGEITISVMGGGKRVAVSEFISAE